MPVITVSRLAGSGGAAIGQRIADALGASYLDTQILHQVGTRLGMSDAEAAQYDERAEAFIDRLARVLWLANPVVEPVTNTSPALPLKSTSQSFVEMTREVVREAAKTGNVVIFGHGSQYILARQPGVLHVRFIAPFPDRVARVMQRQGLRQAEAEQWVRAEDQRRATYTRQYYQADWFAPDAFHLVLNTALWSQEACVRLVLEAAAELSPAPPSGGV